MKLEKITAKTRSTSKKAVISDVIPTVAQAIVKQDKEILIASSQDPQKIFEAIRLKAYELYLERNGVSGDDREDWLKAERIVLQDASK